MLTPGVFLQQSFRSALLKGRGLFKKRKTFFLSSLAWFWSGGGCERCTSKTKSFALREYFLFERRCLAAGSEAFSGSPVCVCGGGGANARLRLLLASVQEKLSPSEPFFGLRYATTVTNPPKEEEVQETRGLLSERVHFKFAADSLALFMYS